MLKYVSLTNSQEVNVLPNIKSAKKRVKISKFKTLRNSMFKSALRTSIKKAKESLNTNASNATETVKSAIKALDKSVAKNILHKNTASRKKSQLMRSLNNLKK